MSYVDSSKIKVFPFSRYRSTEDTSSRLFYEQNVSNIIRQLINTDGFVISGGVTGSNACSVSNSGPLCLNVYGYYFEIDANTVLIPAAAQSYSTGTSIYASITLTNTSPKELVGQDDSSGFTALNFTTTEPESGYYIKVATKTSSSWKLADRAKVKFTADSFSFDVIDGKH